MWVWTSLIVNAAAVGLDLSDPKNFSKLQMLVSEVRLEPYQMTLPLFSTFLPARLLVVMHLQYFIVLIKIAQYLSPWVIHWDCKISIAH